MRIQLPSRISSNTSTQSRYPLDLRGQLSTMISDIGQCAAFEFTSHVGVFCQHHLFGVAARRMQLDHFEKVGSALLHRKRLFITYQARGTNEVTEREVSPQRLMHYRENWYLDAWCHLRKALRAFSVDAIRRAEILEKPAREVSEKTLDAVLGAGYGIFSGRKLHWAKLRFTPERARWVSCEQWHPRQKGKFEEDGSFLLEIPYADTRELTMDILKYGPDVEVLGPQALRSEVIGLLRRAQGRYG
jgi:predicted DNA-binding transcriptional regulator YafY